MDEGGAIVERAMNPTGSEHPRAFFARYRRAHAVIAFNITWRFVNETRAGMGLDACLARPAQVKAIV